MGVFLVSGKIKGIPGYWKKLVQIKHFFFIYAMVRQQTAFAHFPF